MLIEHLLIGSKRRYKATSSRHDQRRLLPLLLWDQSERQQTFTWW